MSGNSAEDLVRAVRQGDVRVAKNLIDTIGLSHSKEFQGGYALLCEALRNDDEDMAKLLLNSGCKVNVSAVKPQSGGSRLNVGFARTGCSPLHFVVGQGNEAMAKLLLARGADLSALNRVQKTPLHIAAEMRREKIVKLLLKNGANVDACDKYGKTALYIASDRGELAMVEYILNFCPDLNIEANRNSLYTAVSNLAYTRSRKIAEALRAYGFTVCAKDTKVACILHEAIEQGNAKVVETLVNLGADVDTLHTTKKGVTLLHTAVVQRQVSIVELLLSHGANVNIEDEDENIPVYYAIKNNDKYIAKMLLSSEGGSSRVTSKHLHLAVIEDSLEIVEILLYYALNLNIDDSDEYGRTALYYTAMPPRVLPRPLHPQRPLFTRNHRPVRRPVAGTRKFRAMPEPINTRADMAKMFLSRGADPNFRAEDGMTPLHLAAESGYTEVVQILLENGASVDSPRTKNGSTALHLAAARDNGAVAMLLLAAGAPVNATEDSGKTSLHIASANGHEQVVSILAERGANVNVQDFEQSSPLHLATVNDNLAVVGTLLFFGADLETRDRFGRTALHLAVMNSKPDITISLVNHGADVTVTCNNSRAPMDYAIHALNSLSVSQLLEYNMTVNGRRRQRPDYRQRRHMAIERLQQLVDVEQDLTLMREIIDYLPELLQMLPRHRAVEDEAPVEVRPQQEPEAQPQQEEQQQPEAQQPVERQQQQQKFGNRLFADVNETAGIHEFCHEVFHSHHDDVYIGQILEKQILASDVLNNHINGKAPKVAEVDYERQFQGFCLAELEKMAATKVGESHVTCHGILTASSNQLVTYARNKHIVSGMEGRMFEAEFPLYGRTMSRRFIQAHRREYLLRRSIGSLISLSRYVLPSVFVRETLKYLDNTDLENLSKADPGAGY